MREYEARLILLARTPFPPEQEWKIALDDAGTPARLKQRIRKLIELKSLGAEVLVTTGDVCSRDDVRRAIDLGIERFGPLHGVIHAAGVIDDGPLQTKSPAKRSSRSRPQGQGDTRP